MIIKNEFKLDEEVFDDLTQTASKIIGIDFSYGYCGNTKIFQESNIGYWVDNKYLGGGRHPWELTKLRRK